MNALPMGRRSVSIHEQDRWVFNRLAEDYAARPGYPTDLVDRLAALAGGRGGRVADLGAGVGHLSLSLAARGLAVSAVEPARAMLDALVLRAAGGPKIVAVHAAAEATALPGAAWDLVLLADAVHWVDPERCGSEVARLLAPGGVVAIVEAFFAATPFMNGLARLLARENPKARSRPTGLARQIFGLATPGAAPNEESFRQDAELDASVLNAVLRSFSFVGPALSPIRLSALLDDAARLAKECEEARFTLDITLRWARRRFARREESCPV